MAGARVDYWREYFRSANADIFEIIEGAIKLAASDCPKEFKVRRDSIAQILFSCKLFKCSGCDKEELALPVDDQENRHHGDGGFKDSSKVANFSRNDDNEEDEDDDDHDVEQDQNVNEHDQNVKGDESKHHVSNYSYGEAEALSDEIERESQTFGEVMRIKEIVDNSQDESASVLCNSLRKLQLMSISVEILKATEIGISVNALRKHASKDIREIAKSLIIPWKRMVDEWVKATAKMSVSENTPESMNPSVLDEEEGLEEGLPSPPLDDLGFLNPHSLSLELTEKFFDDVDDFGNAKKIENCDNGKLPTPPMEKRNVTKWKQQKPLAETTKVSKPTLVKSPVVGSTPKSRMNPTMDRKLQPPEKPILPKTAAVPQQRKPMPSDREAEQNKLEATKRKLQERYREAEKAKKQRTIQVMELHDLPKQDTAPKNQHFRSGHSHYRHWAKGRF
ncbi:putative mediator of RNA polymerase II transcription subunit 26b [Bidens hawaiensis]|uniref:putative mediator of RNA polymerase II transcription subunit 26b n=1 Tax=Bidens hawaiensis TaxID=980011 RepID=UPI004049AC99